MSTVGTHAENLSTKYRPKAIYYEEADSVEYVREDVPTVYRRIDEFLTLVFRMSDRELVGFRLKGFKNFYLKAYEKINQTTHADFLNLVAVLERIIEEFADKIVEDAQKRDAYRSARAMAHEDRVELRDLPTAA